MRSWRFHSFWLVLRQAMAVALAFVTLSALDPAAASGPMYTRDERFGIAFVPSVWDGTQMVDQSLADYDLGPLHVGWFSDWKGAVTPPQPGGGLDLEYVQMLNVRANAWPPDWDVVRQAADANPGSTWIVGNEPEGRIHQGNRSPSEYAQVYHEAYTRITEYDATAKVAIGGVIQPTPLRLRWLDETMAAYESLYGEAMPVDIWNIHVQILLEDPDKPDEVGAGIPAGITANAGEARAYSVEDNVNPYVFESLVIEFRDWMEERGQRNKPLIISEFGVLLPSDYFAATKEEGDRLVERFMEETFTWLLTTTNETTGCPDDENRLVQRWLWYSLNDSFYDDQHCDPVSGECYGFNGSLYDYKTKTLTRFGLKFRYLQQTKRVNLPIVLRQWSRN